MNNKEVRERVGLSKDAAGRDLDALQQDVEMLRQFEEHLKLMRQFAEYFAIVRQFEEFERIGLEIVGRKRDEE